MGGKVIDFDPMREFDSTLKNHVIQKLRINGEVKYIMVARDAGVHFPRGTILLSQWEYNVLNVLTFREARYKLLLEKLDHALKGGT